MSPIDQLEWIVEASNRVVATMSIGHFDEPTPKGSVHEVLDAMFVTAATTAAMIDGRPVEDIAAPFVHGWVPASELAATLDSLMSAAGRNDGSAARLLHITAAELYGQAAALAEAVRAPWSPPAELVRAFGPIAAR